MKKALFITLDSPYIDRRILLFAKALQEIGFQTAILTFHAEVEKGFGDVKIINLSSSKKRTKAIVNTKELLRKFLPAFLFNFAKKFYRKFFTEYEYIPFFEELTKTAKKIKADIYIACDLPTLPIGYEAKIENNAVLIYDAHEFYTEQALLSKKEKKILSEIEKKLIHKADLLITVNEDIANLFKKQYSYNNIKVILNATVCANYRTKYLHEFIPVKPETPIVLYQGGFLPGRNLELLIDLASYLDKSVLVMLGWGILEKELKRKAQKKGILNKKIFFIPKIPQDELISYTSSASFGIIPYSAIDLNTCYCTPNKLFEFICGQVPIVVNEELITSSNFVRKYNIGISLKFSDLKQVADKIEKVLSDLQLINTYKKNLSLAKKIFNWENEKKKLQKIVSAL